MAAIRIDGACGGSSGIARARYSAHPHRVRDVPRRRVRCLDRDDRSRVRVRRSRRGDGRARRPAPAPRSRPRASSAPGRAAGDPAACWSAECTSRPHRWPRSVSLLAVDAPTSRAYACAVIASCAVTTTRPTVSTLVPPLVPGPRELSAANVAIGWLDGAACLLGPAITAVCIATIDPYAPFLVFGTAVAVAATVAVGIPEPPADDRTANHRHRRCASRSPRSHARRARVPSWSCSRRGRSSTVPSTCCTSSSRSMSSAGAPRTPAG